MNLHGDGARAGAARSRRTRGAVTLAVAGVVLLLASLVAPGVAGAEEDGGDEGAAIISIEQSALPFEGDCNPLAQAQLTYTTASTAENFQLVVTSATDPCTPIAAAAVAYRMPDDGQWPQTLVERKEFTISEASVTTITFAKECEPFQFDVITGESPDTIAPTGPWHGPLLFPGDTGTAQQYMPPASCNPTTTTSSTTTTSTTAPPPTVSPTVTTPTVAGETTIAPASTTPTVKGTAATNASPTAANLAMTGRTSAPLALVGGLLLVAGLALFAWSRRRHED